MRLGKLCGALVLVVGLGVSGCGGDDGNEPSVGTDGPYDLVKVGGEHPEAGAAGSIVQCDTFGSGGGDRSEIYSEGATAKTAKKALKVARSEGGFNGVQTGLKVAQREKDRELFVVRVDGVIKQAVIVRDGPATEGAGGPGWHVESWAVCDASELPASFNEEAGHQIWTDESGDAVPTAEIESWTGPEHCDWQSMTFLYLGKDVYVREPIADVRDFYEGDYRSAADLPKDAVDSGYRRDGKTLWLAKDGDDAYVGTEKEVEVWPRLTKPLGCD